MCRYCPTWRWHQSAYFPILWLLQVFNKVLNFYLRAFQVALVVKNSFTNAGDAGVVGSIPRLGRSPGEGNGNPLQYSYLENSMDRGAWRATVQGVAETQTRLSTHFYPWNSPARRALRRPGGRRWTRRVGVLFAWSGAWSTVVASQLGVKMRAKWTVRSSQSVERYRKDLWAKSADAVQWWGQLTTHYPWCWQPTLVWRGPNWPDVFGLKGVL